MNETPTGWDALPVVCEAAAKTVGMVTALVLVAAAAMFLAVWVWSRWDQ